MIKNIFFDFNGTIIDDIDLCIELLNGLLKKENKPLVTKERYKEIFTFPIKDYYLASGIDFEQFTFEELAVDFINQYQPRSLECGLFPGCIETFEALNKAGYQLYILSASEINNLLEQCNHYGITKYFKAILGINNIHAASKVDIALEYMNKHHLNEKETLFIGDTLHDYEVANAMKVECRLVSCGHQSYERLQKAKVKIYDSINDLLKENEL